MHDNIKFNPEKLIKKINKCDKIKTVKLYIYKIIYNLNNKQLNVFLNDITKIKYKFDKYDGINDFIKLKDEAQLNYGNKISEIYKKLIDQQRSNFKDKIINDNFYIAAYNLILLKLK